MPRAVSTKIPPAALKILKQHAAGAPLWGERTFPFPYHFHCGDISNVIEGDQIAVLVTRRAITASQPNPSADRIDYQLTDEGRRYLDHGQAAPLAEQTEWVGVPEKKRRATSME